MPLFLFLSYRVACFHTMILISIDWEPTTFSCLWTVLTKPESVTIRGMDLRPLTIKVSYLNPLIVTRFGQGTNFSLTILNAHRWLSWLSNGRFPLHSPITREVVSSTPAGPTLRVPVLRSVFRCKRAHSNWRKLLWCSASLTGKVIKYINK